MKNLKQLCLWTIVLAASPGLQAARAEETVQKAREILKNCQDAVVGVSALCKMDMSGSGLPIQLGGLGEAQESSCVGVVLDESGLTMVSYSALNPLEKVGEMMNIRLGDEGGQEIKPKNKLSRVQIQTADGKEIPARVVFKDKELDLAFLAPNPKEGETVPAFKPIKLEGGSAAKELDNVVILTRHAKHFGYQPVVKLTRISSVITKPRLLYDLAGGVRPGALAFLADGQLLGMVIQVGEDEKSGLGRMMGGDEQILVLPTAEIAKLTGQAKEAAVKKAKEGDGE